MTAESAWTTGASSIAKRRNAQRKAIILLHGMFLILSKMYLLLIIALFFMSGNGEGRAATADS